MIRRLLLFLVLLGLGFLVLRLALGSGAFTTPAGAPEPEPKPPRGERAARGGIDVQPQREGAATLTLSIEGEFAVQPTREVPLPDGSTLLVPRYRLHADDARPRPEGDNLMELRGVTVELFRLLREGGEPRAEKSAELTATTVLVEIERDARGRPSIHEDREMDFHDAHFRTSPGGGLNALALRVARARLRLTDTSALLRTAEREPFTLDLGGERPATVTGLGLHATMPSGDTPGPVEVRVLSEPRLVTADGSTELSARGELRFTEQPEQDGTLTLRDDVTVRVVPAGDGPPVTARGSALRAGMRRTRAADSDRPGALWQSLALLGTPAQIDAGEVHVDCDRVDVLPAGGGGVGLLAATGTPARLTLTPRDGAPAVLTSERRICMVPLADPLHEWIGPLGFPRGALGRRFAQIITFAGRSTVDAEREQGSLALTASDGLVLLRGTSAAGSSSSSLRALGTVAGTLPDDDATLGGDDGLLLHEAETSAGRAMRLALGVGGAAAPRFALRRGEAFSLEGQGQCRLAQTTRGAQQQARIDVACPLQDGVVRVPEGTLRAVRTFGATVLAGAIVDLEATGTRCVVDGQLRDGTVRGEAARVHSGDGRTFRLHGAPARVLHGDQGEVFGDVVDLLRFGDHAGLRARGNARVLGQVARADGSRLGIDLRGAVAEVLPWRVAPAALRWHQSFLPMAARVVCAPSWLAPHVHVRDQVHFTLDDPDDPAARNTGAGDELWLALEDAGGRGLLFGHPASVHVAADEQAAHGRADAIAFVQAAQKLVVTLVPAPAQESALRLLAAGDAPAGPRALSSVRELTVHCRGAIRVEEREIRFLGPVRVLGAEAAERPPALTVTAAGMVMHRDASGAVTDIVASEDVVLLSPRVRGTADSLALDLRQALAVLSSRRGVARVVLDGGPTFTSSHLEVDYTTYAVRAWYGHVAPGDQR